MNQTILFVKTSPKIIVSGIPRKQPTLTTDKTLRIYVRQDGELPIMLDCLLRFAWILNLIGLSGIVLHCLTNLQVNIPTYLPSCILSSVVGKRVELFSGTRKLLALAQIKFYETRHVLECSFTRSCRSTG